MREVVNLLIYLTTGLTGLGLFLLGMKLLTTGLNRVTSSRLQRHLKRMKIHPLLGILIGIITTMLIQSSSGITVIIVGLVEANLLTLYQATPIIMGANIGTTITAQLIAFKVGRLAPFILILGLILSFIKKRNKISLIGEVLVGFSLIFIGMDLLSQGVTPLQDIKRFQEILSVLGDRPFLGMLMGFSTTAIIQSSSTGIAILQSLARSNAISITSALPILLGQNVGTCVTTLLASLSLSSTGKRAAFIHLLFNSLGVIVFFPFINLLSGVAIKLAPLSPARQIAHAHSLFNIISTLLFIPLIGFFVKAAEVCVQKKP